MQNHLRDKECPDYLNANVTIENIERKKIKIISRQERFYLKELLTPPRCHLCFDKMNIHADLVFGDPWGIEKYDKIKGESIVISRNELGQKIIEDMIANSKAILREVNYQDILNGQKIDERIKRTFFTAKIYEKLGYELPLYFKQREETNIEINKKLKKRIVNFLAMESNTVDRNLKEIKRYIKRKNQISKIKQIIKFFINFLLLRTRGL